MKRSLILTALLAATALAVRAPCVRRTGSGGRERSRHSDQPSRPRLFRRAILQHGLRHRSRRQQAGRRHPPGRSAAGEFQPALQGPGAGAWHGLFARPSHARRRLDRLQCGDVHRYRDQRGQTHDLCRPLAARGVLHAGRQGSLGDGARRELRRRCSTARPTRKRRGSSFPTAPA